MKKSLSSRSLYRLIYCSRNVILNVIPGADPGYEIRTILKTARRRNKADDITGALLVTASGFAQALEGARDAVERTFDRIAVDPRHADVALLSFTPTARRSFPDWPLGCRGDMTAAIHDPLSEFLADASSDGARGTTGTDVLRLLEKLVSHEDEPIGA